ncbi:MAG: capsid protein [Wigfec virus K19_450]|nr:MAG: capsid protein [Wigfec virus K19_450]
MPKYSRRAPRGSNRFGWRKLLPYAVNTAANVGRKYLVNKINTATQKRTTSGRGVSGHYDRSFIYRRRRAPARVRRRAKRSFRSFKSKVLKMKGHRTLITNQSITVSGNVNEQAVKSFVLYGGRSDGLSNQSARGYDDMNDMRSRDYMIGDTTGDAQQRFTGGDIKWLVKTGIMDMTIENTSAFSLELDVYEFICGKIHDPTGFVEDVEQAIAYYQAEVKSPGAATNLPTLYQTNRGVTPFEFGSAMAKFGMKILKKTKYFITEGGVITYQIRNSKICSFNVSVYDDASPTTRYTRGVYVVSKPTPGSASEAHEYIVGMTRKYKYVVDSSAANRAASWEPIG